MSGRVADEPAWFEVESAGFDATYDVTEQVKACLARSQRTAGVARVCVVGSTVGLTVMRYEQGAVRDLLEVLAQLAPSDRVWQHQRTTDDPNGFAHVKCSLVGTGVLVPVRASRLDMPERQRIVLFDFDIHPSARRIVVDL